MAEKDIGWCAAADIPPSPHPTGRHNCGFPGCERGLHPIFNPRAAMTSHYCSICQNVFCHHHTRHSPHGKLGSCGMESKCICKICYEELPRITQVQHFNAGLSAFRSSIELSFFGGSQSLCAHLKGCLDCVGTAGEDEQAPAVQKGRRA